MMTNCGCREISHEPIEFEIQKRPQVYVNCGPLLPNDNEPDLCELQSKVICDFKNVIKQLECGEKPDIENILEQISLIFMKGCGYNVAKKMYSTDLEEDYFLRHNNFLSEFETQEEKDQVLMNLGIYNKINNMVTQNDLSKKLDTKIGFIAKVGKFYYGFATSIQYSQWLNSGDDELIIGEWLAPDYVPISYTIAFNNMENIGGDPVASIDVFEGTPFTFPMPTWSSDTSRHFIGWYTEYNPTTNEYSGNCYAAGTRFIPEGGMVFYAKWVKESKTLSFYPNFGNNEPIIMNSYLGETVNLYQALENRTGYTFIEWNTQSDGTGISYNAGQPYEISQDQSFFAQWKINEYTVTFDFNYPTPGDSDIPSNQQTKFNYGDDIIFPSIDNIITSDGKIIKGWNININGDGTNPTKVPDHDITFYAQWEFGYKYKLATELPESEPEWNISSNQQITLLNLIGWNNWKEQDNQYIILPKKVGKSIITDYIDILDQFSQSIIEDFEIIDSNIETIVIIKQNGFSPLDDSDQNGKLIIKI